MLDSVVLLVKTVKYFLRAIYNASPEGKSLIWQYPRILRHMWRDAFNNAFWGETEYWHRY